MIALEMKVQTTPQRKRLVEILANIETTTSLALERADEFLLSGKQEFKRESQENWKKNVEQMETLQKNEQTLTKEQIRDFKKLQISLSIRSGEEWNLANHLVSTQAAPIAFRIKELLNDMTAVQERLLENDVEEISTRTHFLIVLLVALFITAALISGVLCANISRSISEPLLEI
jgi:methyl-accepting chemotaxis protein